MTDKELLMLLLQQVGKFHFLSPEGGIAFKIENADEVFDLNIQNLIGEDDPDFSVFFHVYKDRVALEAWLFCGSNEDANLSYAWEEFSFQRLVSDDISQLVRQAYQSYKNAGKMVN